MADNTETSASEALPECLRDAALQAHMATFSACARFGMNTTECARYAREGVSDMLALLVELEEGYRG